MNANQVAIAASSVILSLLAAFFLVFNGLFSDGPKDPSDPQRLVSFLLIVAGYGLLGATGSRIARPWWGWPVGLAVPALAICILYPIKEPNVIPIAIPQVVAVLVGVFAGGWLARPRGVARTD